MKCVICKNDQQPDNLKKNLINLFFYFLYLL